MNEGMSRSPRATPRRAAAAPTTSRAHQLPTPEMRPPPPRGRRPLPDGVQRALQRTRPPDAAATWSQFLSVLPATPRKLFEEEAPPKVVRDTLPRDAMLLCLSFLDVTTHTTLSTVSKDWLSLSSEDALWRDHYLNRFSGGSDEGDGESSCDEYEDYKQEYKSRLEDPHVGDDVEVAWRGKFRLGGLEICRGTAWWVAVVVDKVALDAASGGPGRGRKIHAASLVQGHVSWMGGPLGRVGLARSVAVARQEYARGRYVETAGLRGGRCGSQNVPGLGSKGVCRKIRGDAVEVGRVLSTGSLWVTGLVRRARSSSRKVKPAGFLARSWRLSHTARAFGGAWGRMMNMPLLAPLRCWGLAGPSTGLAEC